MKKLFLGFMLFVFSGLLGLFGLGIKDSLDFYIANGTGSSISKIQIIPCSKKYSGSEKEFNLTDVKLKDTDVLSIYLPDDMKKYDRFEITVQCGFRKLKTKQSVNITKSIFRKPILLDFSKKGNDSSFLVATGALTGGVLTIGGIGAAFATGIATNGGAAYVPWALSAIGSVAGGGMAAGITIVAAAPVAAAVVVGGIVWGINTLFPGELVVRSIDYKKID